MTAPHERSSVPPTPARVDKRLHAPDPAMQQARLYRQAVDAAQAGHRATAVAGARELLVLNPRHEAARQLAAHLEAEAGATDRAVALLREGLEQDPSRTALALTLARMLATEGLAEEALAVLDTHAVPGPEAAGLRAGVLARRGDYAAALPAYESAARSQPLNPMWWLGLGVALESLGEPARARQAFGKAHSLGLQQPDLADYVQQRLRALE
ncbi:MAG: tetratricopeptide repeat protein [Rubrivivax sp.]|nr:tetratricopeptide repeat protein [Rubrivivax sp.]